jgi:hypothetical protein
VNLARLGLAAIFVILGAVVCAEGIMMYTQGLTEPSSGSASGCFHGCGGGGNVHTLTGLFLAIVGVALVIGIIGGGTAGWLGLGKDEPTG